MTRREMKIWKVYSNAVRKAHPITEIDKEEAVNLIVDRVYQADHIPGDENVDWDDDDSVNVFMEKAADAAIKYFEKNGWFGCGDFEVRYSDERPSRPNKCSEDVNDIEVVICEN